MIYIKKIWLCLLAFFALGQLIGQPLSKLTVEDAVLKAGRDYLPTRLSMLQWHSDNERFTYVVRVGNQEALVAGKLNSNKTDTLIWIEEIINAAQEAGIKDFSKRFPLHQWMKNNLIVMLGNSWYVYSLSEKKLNPYLNIPDNAAHVDFHKDIPRFAFTIGNDLYIKTEKNPQQTLVASSPEDGIVYGQQVHREEFGITKGTFWSPDGSSLAFYKKDERAVTSYPIVTLKDQPSHALLTRYPMAGQTSHIARVGVYQIESGRTVYLNTGPEDDHYLTNVCWSPDAKYIYIAELNRAQNHMKLNRYHAATGALDKTLFEEKHDKYVEPENPVYFIPGKSQFLWLSERDGYNHLYLYDENGNLIRQVTQGAWVITQVHGLSPDGKYVYYSSTAQEAINRVVQRASLVNPGQIETLNPPITGTHSPVFNNSFTAFLNNFSNMETPRKIYVVSTKKTGLFKLIHEAANPWKGFDMPSQRIFQLENDEGTKLYCREIKPSQMIPGKKYPALVYLYNGPHAQLVNNVWVTPSETWMHYMAQQGFIVFTIDGRGSLNRGRDFENITHRQLGIKEMDDQLSGLSWLKAQNYVDSSRTAVYGWSFGGFMSTSLMLRHPGAFKVGVAGGPVIDWGMYEVMYTERYMDTPDENPQGYKQSNLLNYTRNLSGKLLMIHCSADSTVLWEHSMKFIKKCIETGVYPDYFIYPEHEHNVRGPERVHLIRKVTDYIIRELK